MNTNGIINFKENIKFSTLSLANSASKPH